MYLVLLSAFVPSATAATLVVDSSGSAGTYASISEAVADAVDGDTISVSAGTWYECVDFDGKSLSLEGAGSASTTVDAFGVCEPVLDLSEVAEATVAGLTLSNHAKDGVVISGGVVTLDDVWLTDVGSGDSGSPMSVDTATVSITSSRFDTLSGTRYDAVLTDADLRLEDSDWDDADLAATGGSLQLLRSRFTDAAISMTSGELYSEGNSYEGSSLSATTLTAPATVASDSFFTSTGGACNLGFSSSEIAVSASSFTGCSPGISVVSSTLDVSGSEFSANAADNGAAIYIGTRSTVTTSASVFANNESDEDGGAIYVDQRASWADTGSTFSDNVGARGGAAYAETGVTLRDTLFSGNQATLHGAALYVEPGTSSADATVTLSGCAVSDGTSTTAALYLLSVDTNVDGCTLSGNGSHAIRQQWGTLAVTDSAFEGNSVIDGSGGGIWFDGDSLTLVDTVFENNTASESGGGLYANGQYASGGVGTVIELSGVDLLGNTAVEDGGGASFGGYAAVTADDLWAVGNSAGGSGGGIYNVGTLSVSNAFICGNTADTVAGLYAETISSSIIARNTATTMVGGASADVVSNVTFAFNESPMGGNLFVAGGVSSPAITNTIVAWALDGYGVYLSGASLSVPTTYTDFYENLPGDAGGYFTYAAGGFGNTDADPMFVALTADGDCWTDSYALAASSSLVDAGDTDVLDADGTRSDIGGTGGPASAWTDADADGWLDGWDCDDGNADVSPDAAERCDGTDNDCDGTVDDDTAADATVWYLDADGDGAGDDATALTACSAPDGYVSVGGDCDDGDATVTQATEEIPYDGVDQDCDGEDLVDVDGDGHDATSAGGLDCADDDSGVNPDAEDVPDDGIDQDCSGEDATAEPGGTDSGGPDSGEPDGEGDSDGAEGKGPQCGCASPGADASLSALAWALALGFALRRRDR